MSYVSPLAAQHAKPDYDRALLWATILLLGFGLVMVYSASIAIAANDRHTGYQEAYFLVRQGVYVLVGLAAGFLAFQVPLKIWQEFAPWLFLAGILLLLVVLIPGIGREVNGSRRWLSLVVVNLQPSELMKLFAVMYAADYTVRKAAYMDNFKRGFLPMLIVMLLVGALLLREPDFGAFAVITAIAMSALFLGGLHWKQLAGLAVLLVVGFLLVIWTSPYRMQRVIGFMDPWADPFGKGYQLSHALIAFGRGEWFGVGLGGSVEKLFYLPEAHTDFLLAVIAEELGFAGVCAVLFMFSWVVLRAFQIGKQAEEEDEHFSALVAYGVAVWIGVQSIINMGVNMGMLPTKGLTLPLLSFGGSGIVANCIAIGVVMRVDWESRQKQRGYSV
ncbi:MAG: putative lipid II flippase FtsW [Sulfuricella sp.]|nr:putative lipid II flippase FtsW [Sulfuricella sp.]